MTVNRMRDPFRGILPCVKLPAVPRRFLDKGPYLRLSLAKSAASPFIFAAVQARPNEIFLNAPDPAYAEYPAFKDRPIGGTLTMFIEIERIDEERMRR